MNGSEQEIITELRALLIETGAAEKHRGYHLLPDRLNRRIVDEAMKPRFVFFERERLAYIRSKVDFSGKSAMDIGCNTGYILFDLLDSGARKVTGYEGKKTCGRFLTRAIALLGEENRFEFHNEYYEFTSLAERFDVILLLNVLHHLGDDYGDRTLEIQNAKRGIIDQVNSLSTATRVLVFQMGFNWKGNIDRALFPHGTKAEMIEFVTEGTKDHWTIDAIGVAESANGSIVYRDLDDRNVARVDALGEFLNRPIFVLRSKHR